ncbi:Translation initiation factor 2 [Abeliophyllum distichum]|uniref:Translation initiation factor 2 n=1 Tax=Abeliophyllum distichum TaxID=126358 RepID=A0ABD1TWY2_9LAMI
MIVKADVQGTVQAVTDAVKNLNSSQVYVKVIHAGVGPLSQSDIDMAKACGACIVGFNVRDPPSSIAQAATQAKVKIKLHRVIYHLLEDIGNFIVEKAPGTLETQVAGEAQVLNIFELKGRSKAKGDDVKIAGCRVIDGRVTKSSTLRLLRSGEVVFEGSCTSLKREKQDVEAVGKGSDCGLVIKDFFDFQFPCILLVRPVIMLYCSFLLFICSMDEHVDASARNWHLIVAGQALILNQLRNEVARMSLSTPGGRITVGWKWVAATTSTGGI